MLAVGVGDDLLGPGPALALASVSGQVAPSAIHRLSRAISPAASRSPRAASARRIVRGDPLQQLAGLGVPGLDRRLARVAPRTEARESSRSPPFGFSGPWHFRQARRRSAGPPRRNRPGGCYRLAARQRATAIHGTAKAPTRANDQASIASARLAVARITEMRADRHVVIPQLQAA